MFFIAVVYKRGSDKFQVCFPDFPELSLHVEDPGLVLTDSFDTLQLYVSQLEIPKRPMTLDEALAASDPNHFGFFSVPYYGERRV